MRLPRALSSSVKGVDLTRACPLPALLGGPPAVEIPGPHHRWPLIGPDEEAAVLAQLRTGELSYGRRAGVIEEFEDAFAAYHAIPYAMSTSSGTSALHAAFFSLDLDMGDEVLAPAYTHLATVFPMMQCGLIPVLCDVDRLTGNFDVQDAESRMSARTRALVVTHQYGNVCDMSSICAFAQRYELRVIEDCSHAHGASRDGQLAGTFGDVAAFSLQAHKAVPTGEGGILITREDRLFERAALLGHFRQKTDATSTAYEPFVETGYGLKNRLHPLAAALGVVQLRKLPERIAQRQKNLSYFGEGLRNVPGVYPVPTGPNCTRGGFFRYVVHYDKAQLTELPLPRYVDALRAEGVEEVQPGSLCKPLHLTPFFQTLEDRMHRSGLPRRGEHVSRELVYRPGDFPRAEQFSASTLQFPAFTEPSEHIIDAYVDAMRKVARHAGALAEADR